MAQKAEDCPLRKGGIPNALHRLEGAHPPHEERRKQRWLRRRGSHRRILQYKVRTLELYLGILDL